MIRSDAEYWDALNQIQDDRVYRENLKKQYVDMGFSPEKVNRLMEPVESFLPQLEEDVAEYERLKRGEIGELTDLRQLGRFLIKLRIARGLTQRQLAERLRVHESLVSRDERNEYHGITSERAARILEAMGAQIQGKVILLPQAS